MSSLSLSSSPTASAWAHAAVSGAGGPARASPVAARAARVPVLRLKAASEGTAAPETALIRRLRPFSGLRARLGRAIKAELVACLSDNHHLYMAR